GEELETNLKSDPGTQRYAAHVDEVALLPLTETPVRDEVLTAVHARLSGARVEGAAEVVRSALQDTGVAVFPGWEYYANAGAEHSLFDWLPEATVFLDEPAAVQAQ